MTNLETRLNAGGGEEQEAAAEIAKWRTGADNMAKLYEDAKRENAELQAELTDFRRKMQRGRRTLDQSIVDCNNAFEIAITAEKEAKVAKAKTAELEAQIADLRDLAYNRAPKLAAEVASDRIAKLEAQLRLANEVASEAVKAKSESALRVRELKARLAEAERQNKRLFDSINHANKDCLGAGECYVCGAEVALRRVEWVGAFCACPWCLNEESQGHKPDCARQAALAPEPEPPRNPDGTIEWPALDELKAWMKEKGYGE